MLGLFQPGFELALLGRFPENCLEQANEMIGRHPYFSGYLWDQTPLFGLTQQVSRFAKPDQYIFVKHSY
jgi:hypothetical protein